MVESCRKGGEEKLKTLWSRYNSAQNAGASDFIKC